MGYCSFLPVVLIIVGLLFTDLFKKCVIFGGTRTNGHYDIKEGVPQSPKKLIKKKSVGEFERK